MHEHVHRRTYGPDGSSREEAEDGGKSLQFSMSPKLLFTLLADKISD